MENNYFDNAVRDAIGDYEANFPASDWDEMEGRLNEDSSMRRKVYIAKGIEVCLMVFAIWTVVHLMPGDGGLFNYSNNNVSPSEPNSSSSIISTVENEEKNNENAAETVPFEVEENNETTVNVPIAQVNYNQSNGSQNANTFVVAVSKNQLSNVKITTPIAEQVQTNIELPSVATFAVKEEIPTTTFEDWAYIQNIQLNGLQTDQSRLSPLKLLSPTETSKETSRKPKRKFRIGPVASVDWFDIKSPAIAGLSKKQKTLNAAFGVTTDAKLANHWRFESGFNVSNRIHKERSYSPMMDNRAIEETKSTFATTTLEIPTNLKYEFGDADNKNHLYVLGGVSNHLVMLVKNELEEQHTFSNAIFNDPKLAPQTDPTRNTGADLLAASSYDTIDNPTDPTIALNNNHFISANAGIGYERKLNKRLSIFGQVLYKYGLQSVGRDEEKISSVSVSTGMRSTL